MRERKPIALWVILAICLFGIKSAGYEDNTHQQLTKRALQIAAQYAPNLPIQFRPDQKLGIQVIAAAGLYPVGEDYTSYKIIKECPLVVKRHWNPFEPLNHFKSGLFGGSPAFVKFAKFYNDAVTLWKGGKKAEAAFILGRALHLVEDMAQPQHAMNRFEGWKGCAPIRRVQSCLMRTDPLTWRRTWSS